MTDDINIIEDLQANVSFCWENRDGKDELFYLDWLIRVHVGNGNECFRAFIEFLYKQRIERDMGKAILEVRKNKLNNLRIVGKNNKNINLNEDDK